MRSMTGFGRAAAGEGAFSAEARSVNHRYLEVSVRLPRQYAGLEERVRAQVRARCARGRVDLVVSAGPASGRPRAVRVDTALAARYHRSLQDLAEHLGLAAQVDAGFFLGLPGVLELAEPSADEEADWPELAAAVELALDALEVMRWREGEALGAALREALGVVRGCLEQVAAMAPLAAQEQVGRVRVRWEAWRAGNPGGEVPPFDPVVLLERSDIAEELERLRSHLGQADACLLEAGPVGRRLEFLAQEMQREWGTISAKAADREIADAAVRARVAVEQVREQVQNIE